MAVPVGGQRYTKVPGFLINHYKSPNPAAEGFRSPSQNNRSDGQPPSSGQPMRLVANVNGPYGISSLRKAPRPFRVPGSPLYKSLKNNHKKADGRDSATKNNALAQALAGGIGASFARLLVNNSAKTIAGLLSGLPFNKARDTRLRTAIKFTGASAIQGATAYSLKDMFDPIFKEKLGEEAGALAADSMAATTGAVFSHPFMVTYLRGTSKHRWFPTLDSLRSIFNDSPRLLLRGLPSRSAMASVELATFFESQKLFAEYMDDESARMAAAFTSILLSTPFYQVTLKQVTEDKKLVTVIKELLWKNNKPADLMPRRNLICFVGLYMLSILERYAIDKIKITVWEPIQNLLDRKNSQAEV